MRAVTAVGHQKDVNLEVPYPDASATTGRRAISMMDVECLHVASSLLLHLLLLIQRLHTTSAVGTFQRYLSLERR